MGATGLSTNPTEYRERLAEQPDEQIDAWAAELMRDVAIRRGVLTVIRDYLHATGLSEAEFERVFAAGGGPPAVIGRGSEGHLMVPAVTLYALVPGTRAMLPDGRDRLVAYLVESFEEFVFV